MRSQYNEKNNESIRTDVSHHADWARRNPATSQAISAPRRAEGKKVAAASKEILARCPITVAIGKSGSKSPPRLLHLTLLLLAIKSAK